MSLHVCLPPHRCELGEGRDSSDLCCTPVLGQAPDTQGCMNVSPVSSASGVYLSGSKVGGKGQQLGSLAVVTISFPNSVLSDE